MKMTSRRTNSENFVDTLYLGLFIKENGFYVKYTFSLFAFFIVTQVAPDCLTLSSPPSLLLSIKLT